MKIAGIICEYNPFHLGHARHIEMTRKLLGHDSAIVCVMSGNFVQRGDFAIFSKHARAESAVRCGADLVVELPAPYALSSAESFASAGVYILDKLGVCDFISFGSESGDIGALKEAALRISSAEANDAIKKELGKGLPYASARQIAADAVLGELSELLKQPNNLLGIEYMKAIYMSGSPLRALTVKRAGGAHDGDKGYSASALRASIILGKKPWGYMPRTASTVYKKELTAGRGPVSMKSCELAILSRLRSISDFSALSGASEGLENRFSRYAASAPTVEGVLESIKTKRYAMSRLRRMLMCACLGIAADDIAEPPPYIRALAMNRTGMEILKAARDKAGLPIITKPSSVKKMPGRAGGTFEKEAYATDFYVLAYPDENKRYGGQEWRQSPVIIEN